MAIEDSASRPRAAPYNDLIGLDHATDEARARLSRAGAHPGSSTGRIVRWLVMPTSPAAGGGEALMNSKRVPLPQARGGGPAIAASPRSPISSRDERHVRQAFSARNRDHPCFLRARARRSSSLPAPRSRGSPEAESSRRACKCWRMRSGRRLCSTASTRSSPAPPRRRSRAGTVVYGDEAKSRRRARRRRRRDAASTPVWLAKQIRRLQAPARARRCAWSSSDAACRAGRRSSPCRI